MTATAEGTPVAARRQRGKASHAQTSIWSRDIGRKAGGDEDIDHPAFIPTLPRVNLLPSSVPESFTLRRIRRSLIALAVVMALGFAAVWYLQGAQIDEARARLDQAQAANAAVVAKVEALAPIKNMYDQITGEQALVATTLAAEPTAALVIDRLAAAGRAAGGPGDVDFTSIAIEYRAVPEAGAVLNPCPNPDPFASDITIGCVTFSGTARTRDQVSALLSAVAVDPLFVGPYVNNSTVIEETADTAGGVLFSGTAGVSVDALTKPLTDEQIAAITAPPPPADGTETPAGGE
jgi:Tfp pilus assembly protein PilN